MSDRIEIPIDTKTIDGYNLFIKCKKLPRYSVSKNVVITDTMSYGFIFGDTNDRTIKQIKHGIEFDYQNYVIQKALDRKVYAPFLDCGLGKTIIELVWIHSVVNKIGGKGILLCPLSVVEDIQRECFKLYGYRMSNLKHEEWKTDVAIVNYEGCYDFPLKDLSAICVDESSILKSGDGKICEYLTRIASYCTFRLACSATPSPNDQTEYASHAVFLGISSTLKEFYSRFFIKDGTEWRMKGHAKAPFYDFLKSWSCYIHSPHSIGFERGAELANGPDYIIDRTYPTGDYYPEGSFLSDNIDLFSSKKIFTDLRIDKTQDRFKRAFDFIKNKKGIVWCGRNAEEEMWEKELGGSLVTGKTPIEKRIEIVDGFRRGQIRHIISKGSVLGFGINIPEAEAHLDSGYNFSFEEHYQKIRRSHRYGRDGVLKVYIPVTEPERSIWDRIEKKLNTFNSDVIELQKRFFN